MFIESSVNLNYYLQYLQIILLYQFINYCDRVRQFAFYLHHKRGNLVTKWSYIETILE